MIDHTNNPENNHEVPDALRQAWREYAKRHNEDPETPIYYVSHRQMNIWCADVKNNQGGTDSMAISPTNGGIQGAIDWMNSH